MNPIVKKIICLVLALMMIFGSTPTGFLPLLAQESAQNEALTYEPPAAEEPSGDEESGASQPEESSQPGEVKYNIAEIAPPGMTWEEAYPTGAFIFRESYLYVREGGSSAVLTVLRMGGRVGSAVAKLAVTPVAPDGITTNAAGWNDFAIVSPPGVQADVDNEFDTLFFDLEFAEGEYKKTIEIQAIDDDLSEPEELFIATIIDAEGAEFIDDANRFTMCVQDNDPYIESHVSFAETEMEFDRSTGTAVVNVERTGGTQYVFSVDYETVDGTAKAGVNYAAASGTILFVCGQESAEIEIPLINDNLAEDEADKYFSIILSNPKGGDIVAGGEEAVVSLYNTADPRTEMNIATLVASPQALDISGRALIAEESVITNPGRVTVVPEVKQSVPVEEAASQAGQSGMVPMAVVDDSKWKLAANQGGWKKYTRLTYSGSIFGEQYQNYYDNSDDKYMDLGDSTDDWATISSQGALTFGYEYSEGGNHAWKLTPTGAKDPYGYAIMKATDLDGLYEFYKNLYGHVSLHLNKYYIVGESKNVAKFLFTNNDSDVSNLYAYNDDYIRNITETGWTLAQHGDNDRVNIDIQQNLKDRLNAGINNIYYDRPVMALLDYGWEDNTTFFNWVDDLYVERTAINNLQYEVVCKDGDTYLQASANDVLNKIKPVISFYNNEGGTDANGNFYVGSYLQLSNNPTAGAFKIKSIQLRKKEGSGWKVINTANPSNVIQLRSNAASKVQRAQDLSCLNAETAQYSLYVEMERTQRILIDYSTCVLPQNIAGGETDAQYITRARYTGERLAFRNGIKLRANVLGFPTLVNGKLTNAYLYLDVKDLSSFDFDLGNGEQLLYNGTMYSGVVPIDQSDYLKSEIGMIIYDGDAMSREQTVRISAIESLAMYLDENNNGVVDEATDTLLAYLDEEKHVNTFFNPEKGKDGTYKQKLLKYDYVKVPRKILLTAADDPNLTYNMKASFITTAVGAAELDKMTPQMKVMREIDTGDTAIPIYGAAAARGSITVPLGGDYAPPVFTEGSGWSWTPVFKGKLKTNFTAPAQITEYATVVGNKTINSSQTNDYLGSFRNMDQIILQIFKENGSLSNQYNSVTTYRDVVIGDISQNQATDADAPQSDNETSGDTPGAESPTMDLPEMNIPAGPFEVVVEGNQAGFELGIPLFGAGTGKKEDQNTGILGKNRSKYIDDMKDAIGKGAPDKSLTDQLKKAAEKVTDSSGANVKPKADVDASFMIGFNASLMFAYSELDSQWHFDEAKILVTFKGEVKISQRLPPAPIIYVYIIFSLDATAGLNISAEESLSEEGLRTSEVKFSGQFELEIEVEAGIGIGVDLCKFEIFLKVNLGLVVEFAEEFTGVDEFKIGAALGFRAVFLCFTYEMECISFEESYERARTPDEWVFEWAVFGKNQPTSMRALSTEEGSELSPAWPGTRLYINRRTFTEQIIGSAQGGFTAMSIPTAYDFELGEYNTGASAQKLTDNLRYNSEYKLFQIGGDNYILYMIDGGAARSAVDADMLVLSKITGTGLDDPAGGTDYSIVDRTSGGTQIDLKADAAFDVQVDSGKIKVVWIDNQDITADGSVAEANLLSNSAANTQLKYAVFDAANAAAGFSDAVVLGTVDNNFNFLPRITTVGDQDLILSVRSAPYTAAEIDSLEATYKTNLIAQLGASSEAEAKSKYPYFDFKVGQFRNMNTLYGKYSTFRLAAEKADGFLVTDIAATDDWKNDGTRIEQADIYAISDSEFYMVYATSYNYLSEAKNMTAKHLYLRKGTVNDDGTVVLEDPLLLRSLVDAEDDSKDGIYSGGVQSETFVDPFFSGLEFMEGKLDPASGPELMLIFNMNNQYYVIDQDNLDSLTGNEHSGTIKPFFTVNAQTGDSKADFTIGNDGDGNISAVYTSPVPYTENNAIYLTKYDPYTASWGKGMMLAMRDMNIYESALEQEWSAEETKTAYYNSLNSNAKLIFQKPEVITGAAGALTMVAQTVLTELEEKTDPISGAKVKIPAIDAVSGNTRESSKGFYSMSFPAGTRKIGSPLLLFDHQAFVEGAVLAPRITFRNVGDFALRGSDDKPIDIDLWIGNGNAGQSTKLASWKVTSPVASGESVDTLMDSQSNVYGQIGCQIAADPLPADLNGKYLYFTVQETGGYDDGDFGYSSLDLTKPEMQGISWYSTQQNKCELVIDKLAVRRSGEIVNLNGTKYIPVDIEAELANYGKVTANNTTLAVSYKQTDQSGNKTYLPVTQIGTNGVISLGSIAPGGVVSYSRNNSDYEQDESGNYVIQTDGTLKPNLANDLLLPISMFDVNSADKALQLRFEVASGTAEFESSNNVAFKDIMPAGTIKTADSLNLVPNTPQSVAVEVVSSTSATPDIVLVEMASPNLLSGDMSYDAGSKQFTIKSLAEGETVLRVADLGTAAYKDIVVKSSAELPDSPTITNVLARNAAAVIYLQAPLNTGGIDLNGYTIEARNVNNEMDKVTAQTAITERYELTGLNNDTTYKIRAAARNNAGESNWYEYADAITPAANPPGGGEYNVLDAAYPVITTQPQSQNVDWGNLSTLEVVASTSDGGTLSYQWYKNTINSNSGGTLIENATQAAYDAPTNEAGTTYYYCLVTNTNENAIDTKTAAIVSDTAQVTVNPFVGGGGSSGKKQPQEITEVTPPPPAQTPLGNLMSIKLSSPAQPEMVPYYMENGVKVYVKFSFISGDSIYFLGDDSRQYMYESRPGNFSDTVNHWAADEIAFVAARGLFDGIGPDLFSPDTSMTRGMVMTVLGRLWGADINSFDSSSFTDVDLDQYYAPYVEWAVKNGIVQGIGDDKFAPDQQVSREEIAVMIARFAAFTGLTLDQINAASGFADQSLISNWASDAVNDIQQTGIINGRPGNSFDPQGDCTRAEFCAILTRMIGNMVQSQQK